jgi:hypothetical protein
MCTYNQERVFCKGIAYCKQCVRVRGSGTQPRFVCVQEEERYTFCNPTGQDSTHTTIVSTQMTCNKLPHALQQSDPLFVTLLVCVLVTVETKLLQQRVGTPAALLCCNVLQFNPLRVPSVIFLFSAA